MMLPVALLLSVPAYTMGQCDPNVAITCASYAVDQSCNGLKALIDCYTSAGCGTGITGFCSSLSYLPGCSAPAGCSGGGYPVNVGPGPVSVNPMPGGGGLGPAFTAGMPQCVQDAMNGGGVLTSCASQISAVGEYAPYNCDAIPAAVQCVSSACPEFVTMQCQNIPAECAGRVPQCANVPPAPQPNGGYPNPSPPQPQPVAPPPIKLPPTCDATKFATVTTECQNILTQAAMGNTICAAGPQWVQCFFNSGCGERFQNGLNSAMCTLFRAASCTDFTFCGGAYGGPIGFDQSAYDQYYSEAAQQYGWGEQNAPSPGGSPSPGPAPKPKGLCQNSECSAQQVADNVDPNACMSGMTSKSCKCATIWAQARCYLEQESTNECKSNWESVCNSASSKSLGCKGFDACVDWDKALADFGAGLAVAAAASTAVLIAAIVIPLVCLVCCVVAIVLIICCVGGGTAAAMSKNKKGAQAPVTLHDIQTHHDQAAGGYAYAP